MKLGMIWAQARERGGPRFVVGANGAMPWHVPEDLAHFKRTTLGAPVIMGRKTWDSLPARFRPLPGRLNVVLTRQDQGSSAQTASAVFTSTLDEALTVCERSNSPIAWIIGGGQIYEQAMPRADELAITQLDLEVAGDTFAPAVDPTIWRRTESESITSAQGLRLVFERYVRRSLQTQ